MNFKKIFLLLFSGLLLSNCNEAQPQKSKNILIYSKTLGWRHKSIETGIKAIEKLGEQHSFNVYATEDATYFNNDTLKKYDAILFLNTTGDVLNKTQQTSFKKFIQAGGGFVGVHAATDTELDWPWYGKLIGAYFVDHPEQQTATIDIIDRTHLATKNAPEKWSHFDEWYNFKNISKDIIILAKLDESSYTGGKNNGNHPIAWYQKYDGGKMFYTGLGHTKEAYTDKNFLTHLLGGIQYVLK